MCVKVRCRLYRCCMKIVSLHKVEMCKNLRFPKRGVEHISRERGHGVNGYPHYFPSYYTEHLWGRATGSLYTADSVSCVSVCITRTGLDQTPQRCIFLILKLNFCFQNPHELGPDGRVVYEKKEPPTSK